MRKALHVLMACLLMMCLSISAFAADDVRQGEVLGEGVNIGEGTDVGQTEGDLIRDTVNDITGELAPTVTTEDIVKRLEDKGNDIVAILQTVGKFICVSSFLVCCALMVIGVIGNRRMLTGAVIGAILSGVAYAGIVCGREIVNWIALWAAS